MANKLGLLSIYISKLERDWNETEIKINIFWVFCATPKISESLCGWFGAPYKIRTCDPRFRKPMLYPTELRAQLIYSRYLSQNMSICFLYSIYISRNLSVKRQMSDTNKSTFDNYNSYDSFSCEKCLSQLIPKVSVLRCSAVNFQLPASPVSGLQRSL